METLKIYGCIIHISYIHNACRKWLCDSCHRRLAAEVNMKTKYSQPLFFVSNSLYCGYSFYHLCIHSELTMSLAMGMVFQMNKLINSKWLWLLSASVTSVCCSPWWKSDWMVGVLWSVQLACHSGQCFFIADARIIKCLDGSDYWMLQTTTIKYYPGSCWCCRSTSSGYGYTSVYMCI